MLIKINRKNKPRYKSYIFLSENVYGNNKIFSFKKRKWKKLQKNTTDFWINKYLDRQENKLHLLKKNYKENLQTKQKIRAFFGNILDQQMKTFFKNAQNKTRVHKSQTTSTIEYFLSTLESRLDILLLRLNFAPTIYTSRQWVRHGFISINGKTTTIPNIRLKEGDIISLNQKLHPAIKQQFYQKLKNKKKKILIPPYLEIDLKNLLGILIKSPKLNELHYPMKFGLAQISRHYKK